jgi:hypothetical protein
VVHCTPLDATKQNFNSKIKFGIWQNIVLRPTNKQKCTNEFLQI